MIVKKYEEIIPTKKKKFLKKFSQQGKAFHRFKEKEKFITMVKEFKVNRSTVIFKINIIKSIDKYPKLIKSSVTLNFSENIF